MCLDIVSTRKRSRLGLVSDTPRVSSRSRLGTVWQTSRLGLGSSGLGLGLGLDPEGLGAHPCNAQLQNNILTILLINSDEDLIQSGSR